MTTLPAQDATVETLPASRTFFAVRRGIVALLVPIVWLWLGALAGSATAFALGVVMLLFVPRLADLLNDRLARARAAPG